MHKAAASGPCIFGQCLGNHRYIAETRQGLSPLLRQLVHIEISRTTASPIQDSAALIATGYHTLDDGLDRGKTRAAGHQHQRLLTVFSQEERAERHLEAQNFTQLHLRLRSEEHTSELPSLIRPSYTGFCLQKNKTTHHKPHTPS